MSYAITTIGDLVEKCACRAEKLTTQARQIGELIDTIGEVGARARVFSPEASILSVGRGVVKRLEDGARRAERAAEDAAKGLDPREVARRGEAAAMKFAIGVWGVPTWGYHPTAVKLAAAAAAVVAVGAVVYVKKKRASA